MVNRERDVFDIKVFWIVVHVCLTIMSYGLWIPIYLIYIGIREASISKD